MQRLKRKATDIAGVASAERMGGPYCGPESSLFLWTTIAAMDIGRRNQHDPCYLEVRYEDLVLNARTAMVRVLDFLVIDKGYEDSLDW